MKQRISEAPTLPKMWVCMLMLLLVLGLVGFADEQSTCECVVGDRIYPVGEQHIMVDSEKVWVTIDGSQSSFVRHGFRVDASCRGQLTTDEEICAFAKAHLQFTLWLDGVEIEATRLNSFQIAQTVPESEGCPLAPETLIWTAVWIFEFPGGFFSPGNHELEGVWSSVDFPIACLACPELTIPELHEEGYWLITDTTIEANPWKRESITLTVLYPPD